MLEAVALVITEASSIPSTPVVQLGAPQFFECGGGPKMGVGLSGKIPIYRMDDNWGYPHFRKLPYQLGRSYSLPKIHVGQTIHWQLPWQTMPPRCAGKYHGKPRVPPAHLLKAGTDDPDAGATVKSWSPGQGDWK